MNPIDRTIKRERKQRLKRLLKLRKARDISKNQRDGLLTLSMVDKFIKDPNDFFKKDLAIYIYKKEMVIRLIGMRKLEQKRLTAKNAHFMAGKVKTTKC